MFFTTDIFPVGYKDFSFFKAVFFFTEGFQAVFGEDFVAVIFYLKSLFFTQIKQKFNNMLSMRKRHRWCSYEQLFKLCGIFAQIVFPRHILDHFSSIDYNQS